MGHSGSHVRLQPESMNILEENADHRAPVDYHLLLSEITKAVAKHPETPFSISQTQIICDIDKIAFYIGARYSAQRLLFEPRKEHTFVSTHFADLDAKTTFTDDILRLQAHLRERFLKSVPTEVQMQDLAGYVRQLLISMEHFTHASGPAPSLRYAHLKDTFPLQKQRLHVRDLKTETEPCLKGHTLTIHVERLKDFSAQITQGLLAFLRTHDDCDENDIAEVQKELERRTQKSTSDLNLLSQALVRHSLARLQRAAHLYYLRYLSQGIQQWHAPVQKATPCRVLCKEKAVQENEF